MADSDCRLTRINKRRRGVGQRAISRDERFGLSGAGCDKFDGAGENGDALGSADAGLGKKERVAGRGK